MPSLLSQRIRIMTIYGWIEAVFIPLGILFLGLFLLACVYSAPFLIRVVMAISGLMCIGSLVIFHQYIQHLRQRNDLTPYRIPISAKGYDTVRATLSAVTLDADGSISLRMRKRFAIRLLIQNCEDFDPKELSLRRKKLNQEINRHFSLSQDGAIYEVLNRMRINLVVCPRENAAAVSWLTRQPEQLLRRNEAIIPAVICLEEQLLLFPACLHPLNLAEVQKYRIAAEILIGQLSADREK